MARKFPALLPLLLLWPTAPTQAQAASGLTLQPAKTPMAPTPAGPADDPAVRPVFDRAALAILGTMLTLIVMLTVLLVTVSTPSAADPGTTAQTVVAPHRA